MDYEKIAKLIAEYDSLLSLKTECEKKDYLKKELEKITLSASEIVESGLLEMTLQNQNIFDFDDDPRPYEGTDESDKEERMIEDIKRFIEDKKGPFIEELKDIINWRYF